MWPELLEPIDGAVTPSSVRFRLTLRASHSDAVVSVDDVARMDMPRLHSIMFAHMRELHLLVKASGGALIPLAQSGTQHPPCILELQLYGGPKDLLNRLCSSACSSAYSVECEDLRVLGDEAVNVANEGGGRAVHRGPAVAPGAARVAHRVGAAQLRVLRLRNQLAQLCQRRDDLRGQPDAAARRPGEPEAAHRCLRALPRPGHQR